MTDEDEPAQQTYRLKDGFDRVVRAGLALEGDETIEAYPDIERDHSDVLERVDEEEDGDE